MGQANRRGTQEQRANEAISAKLQRGFIVFDKSEKSLKGLDTLLESFSDPTEFVNEWKKGDAEILLWTLAFESEPCRIVAVSHAHDLLSGALGAFATQFECDISTVRIATAPLDAVFALQVREQWREIGGLVVDKDSP